MQELYGSRTVLGQSTTSAFGGAYGTFMLSIAILDQIPTTTPQIKTAIRSFLLATADFGVYIASLSHTTQDYDVKRCSFPRLSVRTHITYQGSCCGLGATRPFNVRNPRSSFILQTGLLFVFLRCSDSPFAEHRPRVAHVVETR